MKKYLFLLILPILFLLPKDTFASEINSSGWYSGYQDQFIFIELEEDNLIRNYGDFSSFSGGTISGSSSYIILPKQFTGFSSTGGITLQGTVTSYISEMSLYANSSFKQGSYYTINFGFNNGSYINVATGIIRNNFSIKLFDGNDYTVDPLNTSFNISYDPSSFKGNISVTFMAPLSTDYAQIKIGNHNSRYNSQLVYNNSSAADNGFRIYLINVDESQSLSDALLAQLAGQNQTIINQNQQIIDNSNKTNENLKDIEDSLISEEGPDTSELGDVAGWLPPGPVDSILNLPLTLFQNINSALGGTCTPVTATLPYIDYDITLPCMSTIYTKLGIKDFLDWIGVIAGGFILYNYLLHLYQWVEDRLTLKDGNIEWGGN